MNWLVFTDLQTFILSIVKIYIRTKFWQKISWQTKAMSNELVSTESSQLHKFRKALEKPDIYFENG